MGQGCITISRFVFALYREAPSFDGQDHEDIRKGSQLQRAKSYTENFLTATCYLFLWASGMQLNLSLNGVTTCSEHNSVASS